MMEMAVVPVLHRMEKKFPRLVEKSLSRWQQMCNQQPHIQLDTDLMVRHLLDRGLEKEG